MHLQGYLEQHEKVRQEIKYLQSIIDKKEVIENANEITSHINALAGKLNMHLSIEDKHLYPDLRKQENTKVQKMVDEYINEMGGLFEEFNAYKLQFNTKSKLVSNVEAFEKSTKEIFYKILKRMEKEEKGIYTLI